MVCWGWDQDGRATPPVAVQLDFPDEPDALTVEPTANPGELLVSWEPIDGARWIYVGWLTSDDVLDAETGAGRDLRDAIHFAVIPSSDASYTLSGLAPSTEYFVAVGAHAADSRYDAKDLSWSSEWYRATTFPFECGEPNPLPFSDQQPSIPSCPDSPEPVVMFPDKIESDTTTGGAYAQLTLTIGNPGKLVEGSAVAIYLEDDFKVGHIDTSRTYFIGSQIGRVYVTDPVKVNIGDHFGGGDDWDILVRVPDMLPENDTGFDAWSADDASDIKLVLDKAGIRNPTEQGSHSAHYIVLAPGVRVPTLIQPGPDARNLSDLETWAEINLRVDNSPREEWVMVTGHGFNNGTAAEVFVYGPDQGYTGPDEPTCLEVVVNGDSLGWASVDRNDKFIVHFTVHQDAFAPGAVNWICAADSEAGNPRFANEAKVFALTESVDVSPDSGSPGDKITLRAQDYPQPTTADPATVLIRGFERSTSTWSYWLSWTDDGNNSNDDFNVDVDGNEYTLEVPHAFPDLIGLPDFFYLSLKR